VRLIATNRAGSTETSAIVFTTGANHAPLAQIGGPLFGRSFAKVTLSASGSSEPDAEFGDNVTGYEWDLDGDGAFDDATGQQVSISPRRREELGIAAVGQAYRVRVRVTDNYNSASTAETSLQIAETPAPVSRRLFSQKAPVPGAGTEGSGIPAGSLWKTFGMPSINNLGWATFAAQTTSRAGLLPGVYKVSPTETDPVQVAAAKQPAHGAEPGEVFVSFKDPLLNEHGDIAFLAKFRGARVKSGSDEGIFVYSVDGQSNGLIAREGAQPSGVPIGARWKKFSNIAFSDAEGDGVWTLAFQASMVTGPANSAKTGGVTSRNDTGLWLANAQRVELALRKGQALEVAGVEKTVKNFYAMFPATGTAGHGYGTTPSGFPVKVGFTDLSEAILRFRLNPTGAGVVAIETVALNNDQLADGSAQLEKLGVPLSRRNRRHDDMDLQAHGQRVHGIHRRR
jgi:hypothetical protein